VGSTQHPIQWVQGTLSPGVKRPGREADHSPLAGAKVKKMWIYTSTSPCAFMAQCLIKQTQGKLYLSLPFTYIICGFANITETKAKQQYCTRITHLEYFQLQKNLI
jgi:hypothetical protein